MTYLITSTKPALGNGGNAPGLQIFDTEEEAKARAEYLLTKGYSDITLWKKLMDATVQQTVVWGTAIAQNPPEASDG